MKILVTGGAGFIGSAVIREAINHTDHSIMNIDNLIYKETNRLEGIKSILSQFGVSFRIEENTLFICGGKPMFSVQTLDVFPDHRMVMMGALFLKVTGGGELNNSTTVDKSFPEFFSFLN